MKCLDFLSLKLLPRLYLPINLSLSFRSQIRTFGLHALFGTRNVSTIPLSNTHSKPHLSICNIMIKVRAFNDSRSCTKPTIFLNDLQKLCRRKWVHYRQLYFEHPSQEMDSSQVPRVSDLALLKTLRVCQTETEAQKQKSSFCWFSDLHKQKKSLIVCIGQSDSI